MDSQVLLHISYLLLVGASLVRAILPLRIFAIASGLTAVVYDIGIDQLGMVLWEAAFTIVNVVQVGIIVNERRQARLSEEENSLRQRMFNRLSVVDFYRLIRTGTWISANEGEILTRQGHPVSRIVLITDGATAVEVDDKIIAYCRQGDFIGEMAFVSGNAATATVRTIAPSRYLMWRFVDLKKLIEHHPDIRTALQTVFNRNLIDKLSRESAPEAELVN
ncbi:MAG: cyclic nucleotide-binding domain-containing protein [Ignavibacteria bacterium]|nr:cyclic nucleotide-binding domain-containing protein [Ignavibacteria bacterium]